MVGISCLGVILLIFISVAFFSLFERKMMASTQSRMGPNKVSVSGFLQPLSDAMKLITKVETLPQGSAKTVYIISPCIVMFTSLLVWVLLPVKWGFFESEVSVLLVLLYFSISVYGIIFSGWGSNSRYATLGCVRAISQSISYEIGLSFLFVVMLLFNTTCALWELIYNQKITWFCLLLPFLFSSMLICLLGETNRTPFDLAEGESELVSGFNVEYGGSKYTIIFLGENLALLWASNLVSITFLGGSMVIFVVLLMVWVRSTFPRIRYDKMMILFWTGILPLVVGYGGGVVII